MKELEAIKAPIKQDLTYFETEFKQALNSDVKLINSISGFLVKNRGKKLNIKKNKKFNNFLKKIGYRGYKQKSLILSFQRRFRTELINGISDEECFLIAKNLIKLGI